MLSLDLGSGYIAPFTDFGAPENVPGETNVKAGALVDPEKVPNLDYPVG